MTMTTSDHYYEVRIRTASDGRHRMVIKAIDESAARKEMLRWASENEKKIKDHKMWEVLTIPGT